MDQSDKEKIQAVAKQIQQLLIDNHMAMTPSISIAMVDEEVTKEPLISVPEVPSIILPNQDEPAIITPDNNLMNEADFMQP